MKLNDILTTEDDIKAISEDYVVSNNIIRSIDVNVIGHFNNCVSFEILAEGCMIYCQRFNTANLGYLIKGFVELFGLDSDDGIRISEIRNIPCRIVTKGKWGGTIVGFGHFIKDKFVLVEDFGRLED